MVLKIKPKLSHKVLCVALHFLVNLHTSNGRLDKSCLDIGFFPGFIEIWVHYM